MKRSSIEARRPDERTERREGKRRSFDMGRKEKIEERRGKASRENTRDREDGEVMRKETQHEGRRGGRKLE